MIYQPKGGSGAKIQIENNFLIKTDNTTRILRQAEKQMLFHYLFKSKKIKIPKIFFVGPDNSMSMEYIKNSITLSDDLKPQHFEKIDNFFISKILYYSVDSSISNEIFINKLNNISGLPNDIINFVNKILCNYDNFNYLFGINHGDLTTKNILFDGNFYYLIDFLDSFIDSPLQDFSKLFQEVIISGNSISDFLSVMPSRKKIIKYHDFLNISSLFNFLRMWPYLKNDEDKKLLYEIIMDKKWIIV
jgi:thiamine kinase-like enzyme